MKVIHATLYRELPSGVRRQLQSEQSVSECLEGLDWTVVAFHEAQSVLPFERRIPWAFRFLRLKKFFFWIYLVRLARDCDWLVVRHSPFDLWGVLFARFIKNRVSVHHSKEDIELRQIRRGWKGVLASKVERFTGRHAVRRAAGLLAVTHEVGRYQIETRCPGKSWGFFPNGIDLQNIGVAADERNSDYISVVFLSHTFSPWHGLDRVLAWNRDLPRGARIVFHVVGNLSGDLIEIANHAEGEGIDCIIHGHLDSPEYNSLMATADVGLASFAMDRNDMLEGTTLKVREMLAMGVPVYSGHIDSAIPSEFKHYMYDPCPSWTGMFEFGVKCRLTTRTDVRLSAAPLIDKKSSIRMAAEYLKSLAPI